MAYTTNSTYNGKKEDDKKLDTVESTNQYPEVDGVSRADPTRTEANLGNTGNGNNDYTGLTTGGSKSGSTGTPDYTGDGNYSGGGSNSQSDISYDEYLEAMAALEEKRRGEGLGANGDLISGLVDSIVNRGFSYDINDDAMYQQYRDRYIDQAGLAMKDTMGQAAALTGGYGSSYGQAAGQQAYDRTMQGLNDIVPQLEQQAYDRWQDDYNRWVNERAYNDEQADKAKSELISWIQMGYKPTAAELAEAGINPDQYEALKNSLKKGGGGGSVKPSLQDFWDQQTAALAATGRYSPEQIAALVAAQASSQYPGSDIQNTIFGDNYVDTANKAAEKINRGKLK